MASSGTTSFAPDFGEIAEEAFERAGLELRSGYDLETARRSMNFLMLSWANRGFNLWTVESGTVSLASGTATYNLPTDTVDLIEHKARYGSGTSQQDYHIERISVSTYAGINSKNQTGTRPVQIYVNRATTTPTVSVWPVPNNDDYTLVYWRLARIEDAGVGGTYTPDVPFRFLPAIVSGLAYYIAMKKPGVPTERIAGLKAIYEEEFKMAADEDRDRASVRFLPHIYS